MRSTRSGRATGAVARTQRGARCAASIRSRPTSPGCGHERLRSAGSACSPLGSWHCAGLSGLAAAKRWSVPLVFNIQDVFPDVAVHLGAITNRRVIAAFERLERFCYAQADVVTVLSEDLADNVRAKLPARCGTDVVVIPNFVDTEAISESADGAAYRREFGLGDATTVMYAGNVGHSQPLHLMLDTARTLRDRDDVVFVINGEGVARQRWEDEARDLPNVRFVDYQPADRGRVCHRRRDRSRSGGHKRTRRRGRRTGSAHCVSLRAHLVDRRCGHPARHGTQRPGLCRNVAVARCGCRSLCRGLRTSPGDLRPRRSQIGFTPAATCHMTGRATTPRGYGAIS